MKNKGFSMVELIVVIAIMAILAGVLAPMLLKYVHKSRLSADISNGREIASAIMVVVTEEEAKDDAVMHDKTCQSVNKMDGAIFKAAVFKHLGLDPSEALYGKSKKDADGAPITNQEFYYTLDESKNKVEIFYGGTDADHQIYPQTGKKLLK